MNTKGQIIKEADSYIRKNGFNAFSFYDISNKVGIKTASIHYHFPSKADLGVAVIDNHIEKLNILVEEFKLKSPIEKLDKFFSIYYNIKNEDKICLVGSLATDYVTLDDKVKIKLKEFSELFLNWVSEFLESGRQQDVFYFEGESKVKALLIISNMIAIVQLARLITKDEYDAVIKSIKYELLK